VSISGGVLTGRAEQSWQSLQTLSQSETNVGLMLVSSNGSFKPTAFAVNGNPCTIV
jgi:hypothetical protein